MQRFSKTRKKSIPSQILLWMIFFIPLSYFILLYDAHLFRLYTENSGYWTFEFIGIFSLLFSSFLILPIVSKKTSFIGPLPIFYCLCCILFANEEAGNIIATIFDTGNTISFNNIHFYHCCSFHSLSPFNAIGPLYLKIILGIVSFSVRTLAFSAIVIGALTLIVPHFRMTMLKNPISVYKKVIDLPKVEMLQRSSMLVFFALSVILYFLFVQRSTFFPECFWEAFETTSQVSIAIGFLLFFGPPRWGKWVLWGTIFFTIFVIFFTTNSIYLSFNNRLIARAALKQLNSEFNWN